jgi:tetratricopeptide (TPR) repeat protein
MTHGLQPVAVSILLLTACAHGPQRAGNCTLPGADRWSEYRSSHFVIDVAEGYRDPAHLVAVFEELHAAVLAVVVAEPIEIPGRVRVVVVSSRNEVGDIVGSRDIGGMFWVSNLGEPTILVGADDIDDLPQVIAHELTHHIAYYLFPRQPRWFSEGIAQFVEGVAKIDNKGRRWAGGDPTSGSYAGNIKLTPAAELFRWGGGFYDNPYVTSWILYRFLWNERSERFSDFQRRLADGENPGHAWRAAFPEWDPAAGKLGSMDAALDRYQAFGRGIRWEVKLGEVDRAYATSTASSGDLHMLLLEHKLDATNPILWKRVRRSVLDEVLREEPNHPAAVAELARLDGVPALSALRVAAAARPTDGRAWYLLGSAAEEPKEREAALRRAVALWPDGALAHLALASQLSSTGRPREALPSANRALDLAPRNPRAVALLAKVALELARCREALLLQERAVDVATAGGVGGAGSDLSALQRQLADYRTRCELQGGAPAERR